MLQKIEFDDPNVVGFSWTGKFTEQAFHQAMAGFLPELRTRANFNVYVELHALEGVEAAALWKDVKFAVRNMGEITGKINKVALVADENWIKALADVSYALIPGIDLKTFSFSEEPKARMWITGQISEKA